jgi:hypothetical protein
MWFLGSAAMGLLYTGSIVGLVVFGVAAQLAAAVMFFQLRKPLAAAAGTGSTLIPTEIPAGPQPCPCSRRFIPWGVHEPFM